MKYVPETRIGKADELRRLDWKVEIKKNNNNQIFIKNYWLCNLLEVVIKGPEVERIKIAKSKDKEVVRVVEEIKKAGVKVLREEEWQMKGDLVLKEEKVYVPKNKALRVEIIQLHHDTLVAEHGWK